MKGRPAPNERQQRELERIASLPHDFVIGIDEVGFGPWAGPLVVGGVVLPKGWDHPMVLDSKALTPKRRREANTVVYDNCYDFCIKSVEAHELDKEGLENARARLTREVATELGSRWPDAVVVQDGDTPVPIEGRNWNNMAWLPKADALVPAVSAGSIIAKVHRDDDMVNYHEVFPEYAFYKNKGYGTPQHIAGLEVHGPCILHRLSYKPLRRYLVQSGRWPTRLNGTPASTSS